MLRLTTISAALLLLATSFAAAQETLDQTFARQIPDEGVQAAIKRSLSSIQTATCENKKPCTAATTAELANPPIRINDGRAAMVFGIKSAMAQWCGLDMKRSFLTMISIGKSNLKMNDRQLMLMTLIHGEAMAGQSKIVTNSGQCPPELKQQLDSEMPKQ
jgi:hypothetical protein